ncbi:SMI1/KNR4 family protein [Paenibacillus sp. GbtcB18]
MQPAAEEEIQRLERMLQVTLPTAFRDYLSIMNGQHDEIPDKSLNIRPI